MTRTDRLLGIVLAAGAGRRMGMPKALVQDHRGWWLRNAVSTLRQGGCSDVVVVLGARAEEASTLVAEDDVAVVVADDWAEGLSASLRSGLRAASSDPAVAAIITLVDLPDLSPDVVSRLSGHAGPDALARAGYDGRPGHPVLIGRSHYASLLGSLSGDQGARTYLARNAATLVECGDLGTGEDQDEPLGR